LTDFPLVTQAIGSTQNDDDGTVLERAFDGTPRIHTPYGQVWRTFTVKFDHISATNKGLIDTHYSANRALAFNFVWQGDGNTYLCRYSAAPNMVPSEGNLEWDGAVSLCVVPS
jgi:hypothetical protein